LTILQSCGNCRYWMRGEDQSQQNIGICRRWPPTPFILEARGDQVKVRSEFPPMKDVGWCGEWDESR